jgi:hypothetical protein
MGEMTIRQAFEEFRTVYLPARNYAFRTRKEYANDLEELVKFIEQKREYEHYRQRPGTYIKDLPPFPLDEVLKDPNARHRMMAIAIYLTAIPLDALPDDPAQRNSAYQVVGARDRNTACRSHRIAREEESG